MNKREIELNFDGANTKWVMDTEIQGEFVMFGFEEHSTDCACNKENRCIATEQLLDKEDLKMIKLLIDKTLEQME